MRGNGVRIQFLGSITVFPREGTQGAQGAQATEASLHTAHLWIIMWRKDLVKQNKNQEYIFYINS